MLGFAQWLEMVHGLSALNKFGKKFVKFDTHNWIN